MFQYRNYELKFQIVLFARDLLKNCSFKLNELELKLPDDELIALLRSKSRARASVRKVSGIAYFVFQSRDYIIIVVPFHYSSNISIFEHFNFCGLLDAGCGFQV